MKYFRPFIALLLAVALCNFIYTPTAFIGYKPFQTTVTYTGSFGNNLPVNPTSTTYTSVPLGAENPQRVIVVYAFLNAVSSNKSTASLTVNGTPLIRGGYTANGSTVLFYARIPTGTTATVVANFDPSGNALGSAISVYNVVALNESPFGVSSNSTSGNPIIVSLSVPANGILLTGGFPRTATTVGWASTPLALTTDNNGAPGGVFCFVSSTHATTAVQVFDTVSMTGGSVGGAVNELLVAAWL